MKMSNSHDDGSIWKKLINTPLKIRRTGIKESLEMLYKLLMVSLSVKVTLRYVIPSRVLQKWSKEYQPIAPHLFFWMISCYCLLDGSYKSTGETNSFVEGYNHFVGLFLFPNASLVLGSYPTTWGGSFLSTHMEKNEKVCAASS